PDHGRERGRTGKHLPGRTAGARAGPGWLRQWVDQLEEHVPTLTCPGQKRNAAAKRARSYLDDPDVVLMLRVQAGDADAFADLRQGYVPRVFGYFCRLLRDRSEAEDLTQEVFLRLYRSRLTYQPRARFATWIFHITQNVARNAIRSRRRHPCVHLDPEGPSNRRLLGGH